MNSFCALGMSICSQQSASRVALSVPFTLEFTTTLARLSKYWHLTCPNIIGNPRAHFPSHDQNQICKGVERLLYLCNTAVCTRLAKRPHELHIPSEELLTLDPL